MIPPFPSPASWFLPTSNYQRKTTIAKIIQLQNIWVRERGRVGSRGGWREDDREGEK